jgi:WD40 repeat protein
MGDLFGSIALIGGSELLRGDSSFGAVFGIDFDPINGELLTAHEYHACARWKITEHSIDKTADLPGHPSRVWGCLFLPHSPISFGEDGCVHVYDGTNRALQVHRTKNVTALAANENEIVTAGQNGIIRRFVLTGEPVHQEAALCETPPQKGHKSSLTPLCVTVLANGRAMIGTAGGLLIVLPEKQKLFEGTEDIGGLYQIVSFENLFFAASRNRWLLVGHDSGDCVCFQDPANSTVVSLAVNPLFLVVVHSDHKLRVMGHDGSQKATIALDEFFAKPPRALAVHPECPTIALGGHSARVCVIEFADDFATHTSTVFASASNGGFQGMFFCDNFLYSAGRSDGTVSICAKLGLKWVFKASWQIPAQSKTTVHIQPSPGQSAIISALVGQSVGLWDVATQTMLVSFPAEAQRGHFGIWASDGTFSAVGSIKPQKLVSFIVRHPFRALSSGPASTDSVV